MRNTLRGLLASGLILWSGCAGDAAGEPEQSEIAERSQALNANQQAGFGSIAWEYIADHDYSHLTARLGSLVGHGITLTVNVPSDQIARSATDLSGPWSAIGSALALNIPVTLWLSLPEIPAADMNAYTKAKDPTGSLYHADPRYKTHGYFANASNAVEFVAWAQVLKSRFEQLFPGKKATLLVDMEMRKELMPLYRAVSSTDAAAQLDFFQRYGGLGRPSEYNAGINTYKAFVTSVRNTGWKVDVSSMVQMLDDYADGDASLRRAYGIVLDDPRQANAIQWNHALFQAYTTFYGAVLPGLTNYFVYDYARLAKSIYGATAGIDVGLTHGGIDSTAPVYWGPIPLAQDVSAALAAGIPRASIEVYSFLGMFGSPASDANVENWLFPVPPINLAPSNDLVTGILHTTDSAADLYFPAQ
jgi:hypothetical protein